MNNISKPPTPRDAVVSCRCHGCVNSSGFTDESKATFCPICQGAGLVARPAAETISCPTCSGEGKVIRVVAATKTLRGGEVKEPCLVCNGTGRAADPKTPYHAITLTPAERAEARLINIEARLARIEALFT